MNTKINAPVSAVKMRTNTSAVTLYFTEVLLISGEVG